MSLFNENNIEFMMMHQMLQLNYLDDETEVIRGIIERRRQRRMPR